MPENPYATPVLAWYETHARDLPWRRPDATPWGILVSEIMLQQTPVARVLPAWQSWMERWPTPADLAAEPPGAAVRMWDRLGYPRRALNLHASARAIVDEHGGEVPREHAQLLALPGVGSYTAAAVASFAFGQRHAILDTNVRRVLARVIDGVQYPPKSQTKAEATTAQELLPPEPAVAARWGVAVMELGALVCTARSARCGECPLAGQCAWRQQGYPQHSGEPRRGQRYAGTDRQVRGRLLAVLRSAEGPVPRCELQRAWDEPIQRDRALRGLIHDGLVDPLPNDSFALPG
ncbi:A/G-specific adenine glycosylase [Lipingzhangella sp. LS1_29]|uniref:Adenine DNA glycosylase n=1 Tax=Lipingzhangella rawalii TaxID=2055835 RepID=A0ABU2H9E1_9ACTN|nr:A/G-specific adenine glycosylase [Lipingzhangella rawalii]MDS1271934.1 A/G-specific adenine glycosylase [Lipingzhangella rawalii]